MTHRFPRHLIHSCLRLGLVLMLCFLPQLAFAQTLPTAKDFEKLSTSQMWEGKNGKSIRGTFIKREGDHIVIIDSNDKIRRFAIANLSDKTRTWFFRAWQFKTMKESVKATDAGKKKALPPAEKPKPKPRPEKPKGPAVKLQPGKVLDLHRFPNVDTSGFKLVPPEKATRLNVPNYNQTDYGKKASDCVPNSYAMFIAWWHLSKWIEVPGRERDFSDKVDWIHERLGRCLKTRNNSGTYNSEAVEGLTKFFDKEVETKAAFTMHQVVDYRPESLAKHTQGANCTVLMLTMYYGSHNEGGHAVALKRAHPDGTLEFNTWGCSLKAKLKEIPGEKVSTRPVRTNNSRNHEQPIMLPRYEVVLSAPNDLPEWFTTHEGRFELDASQYDRLMVLTPYVPDPAAPPEKQK